MVKISKIELTDGVVLLKPFSVEDAGEHLRNEDGEQQKWISGGKSTIESVQNSIKKNEKYWDEGGPVFNFAIWETKNNELIGMIEANVDYKNIEGLKKGSANISYGLYPKARGKGYLGHALNLVLDFLKQKNVKKTIMRIAPDNVNSLKVPERYGFKKAGSVKTKTNELLVIFEKGL